MKSIRIIAAPALLLVAGALAAFVVAVAPSGNDASAGLTPGIDVGSGAGTVGGAVVPITIVLHDVPGGAGGGHKGYNYVVDLPAGLASGGFTRMAAPASNNACTNGMTAIGSSNAADAPAPTTFSLSCAETGGGGPYLDASPGPLTIGTMALRCDAPSPPGGYVLDVDGTGGPFTTAYNDATGQGIAITGTDGTLTCTVPAGATETHTPTPLPTATVTRTPCPGQVCPTATQGAPTQVAFTQTPTRTPTVSGTATKVPSTPGAPAPTQPGGGPGGVVQPPDTGSGGGAGSTTITWIFVALGAGIAATLGLGIYGRRRIAKR